MSWGRINESLMVGSSIDAAMMAGAGATVLVDLRNEGKPPNYGFIDVEWEPIEDLIPNQDHLILKAAKKVESLIADGQIVGIYCQAGVSRTAAVAIAYLMLQGATLEGANARVREARPSALPALSLWRSLERLEPQIAEEIAGQSA
ncbi:MAG: dual specificity protein phosphatase family protein [Frankiaceae bacterium]|nr:dual specificity protein phosphatase family protein [Frankiaceae bacterium]